MNMLCAALLALFAQGAAIQGVVVRPTGEPLSKSKVELRMDDRENVRVDTITTGEDGTFRFVDIRPGRYQIGVIRSGYVRAPLPVVVTAGQSPREIQLVMPPSAAISGHVYDQNAQPLGNIEVHALKASYAEGHRVLASVDSVVTNDLGEYRLFSLTPGR